MHLSKDKLNNLTLILFNKIKVVYKMTVAELYGKLKAHEKAEDLLTSDIFGGFSYLKPNVGLVPCLTESKNFNDTSLKLLDIIEVDYIFWPKTSHYKREPDLLCVLKDINDSYTTIVIECKYTSPKSNRNVLETELSGGDQLAEQFFDLYNDFLNIKQPSIEQKIKESRKYLLYVTAHYAYPKKEIQDSINRLQSLGIDNPENYIYHISWRDIYMVLESQLRQLSSNVENIETKRLLSDMFNLLARKGLHPFHGFKRLKSLDLNNISKPFFWS